MRQLPYRSCLLPSVSGSHACHQVGYHAASQMAPDSLRTMLKMHSCLQFHSQHCLHMLPQDCTRILKMILKKISPSASHWLHSSRFPTQLLCQLLVQNQHHPPLLLGQQCRKSALHLMLPLLVCKALCLSQSLSLPAQRNHPCQLTSSRWQVIRTAQLRSLPSCHLLGAMQLAGKQLGAHITLIPYTKRSEVLHHAAELSFGFLSKGSICDSSSVARLLSQHCTIASFK